MVDNYLEKDVDQLAFVFNNGGGAAGNSSARVISQPKSRKTVRGRFWKTVASVLLVSLCVIVSFLLVRHYSPVTEGNIPTGKPIGRVGSTSLRAQTAANGLETTLSITPGPYFLSELLFVDITLINHSQHAIMLGGSPGMNGCNGAFNVAITGGQEPHYDAPAPNIMVSCPGGSTWLDANKSVSIQGYIPLTRSGAVSITTEARLFASAQKQNGTSNTQKLSALDQRWPAIAITVAPQIPADRQLSLQAQGSTLAVNAPDSVRPRLVYFYMVNCADGGGTNENWQPLKTTVLQEPSCNDLFRHWIYAVSAPGYAVAAVSMGF